MEAGNQESAASLMTAALSFYEAASQLNDSDIKLKVRLMLCCLADCSCLICAALATYQAQSIRFHCLQTWSLSSVSYLCVLH